MISYLAANNEITCLEISFNTLSLWSGQEENQIRVGLPRRTITMFIVGLLNSPVSSSAKLSAILKHTRWRVSHPTPAADRLSRLQNVSPDWSSWKAPISMEKAARSGNNLQPSTDDWIDKTWYMQTMRDSQPYKEWNPDTGYSMNKPWRLYAERNKPVPEGQILHNSTYVKYHG